MTFLIVYLQSLAIALGVIGTLALGRKVYQRDWSKEVVGALQGIGVVVCTLAALAAVPFLWLALMHNLETFKVWLVS